MPRYTAAQDFEHGRQPSVGVLLANLGTPAAPTKAALRRYLAEFLWDPRVVELPRWLWWLLLHGVILRVRPARSAKAYLSVWTDEGSPLLIHGRRQGKALAEELRARLERPVAVALGMRYGEPSIASALRELREAGADRLLILPLYPQYSSAATGSVFDAVVDELQGWRWVPELRFVGSYHDFPPYIEACANQIHRQWQREGRCKHLLFSYHGIPKRYFLAGDPYHCQCHKTSRLIAERLGLDSDSWQTTFQSRFGKEEWLKPYTDKTIQALPKAGTKSLEVFCPGFSADCLETLEEIAVENRGYFMEAGGAQYHYIPALNEQPDHIEALTLLAIEHMSGWEEPAGREALAASRDRALAMGAER
jgi:ferrochelatase